MMTAMTVVMTITKLMMMTDDKRDWWWQLQCEGEDDEWDLVDLTLLMTVNVDDVVETDGDSVLPVDAVR